MWQFKRDEVPENHADLTTDGSKSFGYKAGLIGKTENAVNGNSFVKNVKIVVSLKYLINFWKSLEMPLINCELHLELTWIENCGLSNAGDFATFKITDTKLCFPIATLSTDDNVKLAKQLNDGFKHFVYWNKYKTIPAKIINNETNIYKLLRASFQGVKRLFVLAYDSTDNDNAGIQNYREYFLPRAEIKNDNVLIHGRNFHD